MIDELRALQQQVKALSRQTDRLQEQLAELLWQCERLPQASPPTQGEQRLAASGGYGSRYAAPATVPMAESDALHDITGCTGRQNAFAAFRRPT